MALRNLSYIDFAREKGALFDRLCAACKADDLASLRELMLLEEFKNCVPDRLAVYLNEQKVSTLHQAAMLANKFRLTHKNTFVTRDFSHRDRYENTDTQVRTYAASGPKAERLCF